MRLQRRRHRCGEAVAVHRQRAARRQLVRVGRAHDQRARRGASPHAAGRRHCSPSRRSGRSWSRPAPPARRSGGRRCRARAASRAAPPRSPASAACQAASRPGQAAADDVNFFFHTPAIRFYFLPLFSAVSGCVQHFCTEPAILPRQIRARLQLRASPKDEGWCGGRSATRISSSRPLFDGRWLAGFGLPHPAILGHGLPVFPGGFMKAGLRLLSRPGWSDLPHPVGFGLVWPRAGCVRQWTSAKRRVR